MTNTRPTLPKLLANKSADELRKLLIDLAKSSKDTREAIFEYYGQYQSPEEFESTFKKQNKQNFYTYSRMMDEYYADSAKAKKLCENIANISFIRHWLKFWSRNIWAWF